MTMATDHDQIRGLYQALIDAWNDHDAEAFAAVFREDGASIGFDGSELEGREEIVSEIQRIFADHQTAPYVVRVRSVRMLSEGVALLRAVAGMIPPGHKDINPNVNAHHTLIAEKRGGSWFIRLFQNTPAQFHGRPELSEKLTQELRDML
jgi:uncharacterized protein (TIGR02246 family)